MTRRRSCSTSLHAAIKADPDRWAGEMANHRAWPGTGLEVAEHPECRSTLGVVIDQAAYDSIGGAS
jgi:hypothetical protein